MSYHPNRHQGRGNIGKHGRGRGGRKGTVGPMTGGLNGPGAAKPTPKPPTPTPLNPIFESQYNVSVGDTNTEADAQIGENNLQSGYLDNDFGLSLDANGNPVANNLNPFNKMKELQAAFERNKLGDNNAAASHGQYFSGAHTADQALIKHDYDKDVYNATEDYTRGKHGFTYQNDGINRGRYRAINSAAATRTDRYLGS